MDYVELRRVLSRGDAQHDAERSFHDPWRSIGKLIAKFGDSRLSHDEDEEDDNDELRLKPKKSVDVRQMHRVPWQQAPPPETVVPKENPTPPRTTFGTRESDEMIELGAVLHD